MSVVNDDLNDTWVGHALLDTSANLQKQKSVPKRFTSGLYVPALTGMIIAAVLAIQGFMLWQSRQEAWNSAVRSGENVMHALLDAVDQKLARVEFSVTAAQVSLESGELDGLSPRQRDLFLFDRTPSADLINSMMVISRRGEVVIESGDASLSTLSLSDRDYFLAHVRKNAGTYLSPPFRSRFKGGDPSVAMSRRLSSPDGSFNGVVMASLRLAYFRTLFDNVKLGPNSIISLIGLNGSILMRSPSTDGEGNIGMDLNRQPVFERMLTSNSPFVGTASVDGKDRLYIFGRVGSFPLLLSVGLSIDDIYAEWNRQAIVFGSLTLAFCVALVFLVRGLQLGLIRSTQMEQLLKTMSLTDVLTGLPNRRAFEERFDSEFRRMAREGTQMALLLIDVDHFKAVNDSHGHLTGDKFLRMLARQIQRSAVRPGDVAARFGGEEFTVLLPSTDVKGAMYIAERIRTDIERTSISLETGLRVGTTVSIGIVTAQPGTRGSPNDLLKLADDALYEAKASGRNRVVWRESAAAAGSEPSDAAASSDPSAQEAA
ncbi:sensor domain-containing diguanylate cyclase [Aquabacter sp. CN5-332]|uniref:sensor domain-containing diguanylate cyclase n=1 Tax=Aquabacter sp. CN5-332 TaxID=3156608 RepID=UPI0032B466F6